MIVKLKMYCRKTQNQPLIKLPLDWLTKVGEIFNATYESQRNEKNKTFLVFGHTFPDEVILIVSLIDEKSLGSIPITLVISLDLESKNSSEKTLEEMVDFGLLVFNDIFSQENWNEYIPNWEKHTMGNKEFFYIISRDNILLTIKADELLND